MNPSKVDGDVHITARGVRSALWAAGINRETGETPTGERLPDEVTAVLRAAEQLVEQVLAGDNAVLVRGGTVQNDPFIPVLDLDFLREPCDGDETANTAHAVRCTALALGWASVADEIEEWLHRHATYDPETDLWTTKQRHR